MSGSLPAKTICEICNHNLYEDLTLREASVGYYYTCTNIPECLNREKVNRDGQ